MHQLVVRGAELGVAGEAAEARAIDQRLRMLDAKTDREWFGLEEHAAPLQHAQRVARAVPQREHHVAAAQRLTVLEQRPFDLALVDQQIGDPALEAHLAAERDDLRAHLLDDAGEAEGADVRLADEQDFLGRAGAHELVHHLAAVEFWILDLAVELAVGEQARPTLAELHVGLGRQDLLAPQRPGVLGSASHVAAALEHDGLESHLRQQQRGEQTAGAEADDQRPLGQCRRAPSPPGGTRCPVRHRSAGRASALEHCGLVGHLRVDDADEKDAGVLLARVVAAFEQRVFEQFGVADPEAPDDGLRAAPRACNRAAAPTQ